MNNEELSALVDDEVSADTCDTIVNQLLDDQQARRTWSRYHLIGEVLSDGRQPAAAVSAEIVELNPPKQPSRAPIAGLAIAASVAVLAVMVLLNRGPGKLPADFAPAGFEVAETQPITTPAVLAPQPVNVAAVSRPTPVNSLTAAPAAAMVPVGAYDQRLNGYLVNFNEQRSRRGVPGVHPYVRIVGFEAE